MQIKFNNVTYIYNQKTDYETKALDSINLEFSKNKMIAIVGRTGSGKSTLTMLIDSLIRPTNGEVKINEFVNKKKGHVSNKKLMNVRKNIGYVFQFPERQLFEESVLKDVCFGVRNFYPKNIEYEKFGKEALKKVGLDETFYNRSPFELSGGEKKRAAIAGIIAYNPELIILDEPTAGLDSSGKKEIMDLFKNLQVKENKTVILITHDMDVVYKYADEIIIIDNGKIVKQGNKEDILKLRLENYNLATPDLYKFICDLNEKGKNIDPKKIDCIDALIKELKDGK